MILRMFAIERVIENASKQLPISAICKQAEQLAIYIRDGIKQEQEQLFEDQ